MDINELDEEISKVSRKIGRVTNIIPNNLLSEKKKFYANTDYNPVFEYPKIHVDFAAMKTRLDGLRCDDSVLGTLAQQKIESLKQSIMLAENLGKHEFCELAERFYGKPSKELTKKAEQELRQQEVQSKKKMLATHEVVEMIKKTIKEYKLGWSIQIREHMIPRISTNRSKKVIFIRQKAAFSDEMLRGTIAHEIETHVFRAENGAAQKYTMFFSGLPNYQQTEEGLAIINSEKVCPSKKLSNQSALRLIGINAALVYPFREVFSIIREKGYAKNIAWNVALRSKKGLTFTDKPGAHTKDQIYFKGREIVKEFLSCKMHKNDAAKLYYGKIGIEHVRLLDKIDGLKEPIFLPKFINEL